MSSRGDARADAEVGAIIGPAWFWRWQAPELALVFGERALRTAEQHGDQLAGLWARTLVVSASCRLGQQLAVVDTAIEALRLSEQLAADDAGAILRVELAGCARSAGVPLVGAGLLRPVLAAADMRPAVRAAALIQLAGCLAYSERHRELDGALAEADQLYADDRELDQNTGLGLRAVLRSFVAREHRRRGDLRSALHAAEEGADLLGGLTDLTADGGAAARISLQQVLGLLDLGWVDQACTVAAGALSGPVRAHSAAAVGWLALAISTRVQLPAGLVGPAIALLHEITAMAERHHRDALHAESLSALSEAHELAGELAETLDYLRSAQVVRARRSRALRSARSALSKAFGEARNPEDLLRLLNPALSTGKRRAVDRDQPLFGHGIPKAAAPDASGITLVLIDVAKNRSGMPPTARGPVTAGSTGPGASGIGTWTAESLGAGSRVGDPIGEGVLRKVVEHLRDLTPAEAALARVGGAELAVLLPATSRSQVERWAEELRAAMADVDWSQVTPGLTVNIRTVIADPRAGTDIAAAENRPARTSSPPATGIALDTQPARTRRSGDPTAPRLPIPQQPTEPGRTATVATDQPVPPARTPVEPEQPGGRRSRGTLPVGEAGPPIRTPLPQASWPGITEPLPEETAGRRRAASQEPTERWTPVWTSIDDEDTGRWRIEPAEEPRVDQPRATTPEIAPPTGLDRFGLGSAVFGTGVGKRRSEDKRETPDPARASHRSPEPAGQSTPDSVQPVARHSAPATESARSVLDSLAISEGSGGRRRAPEPTDPPRPQPTPDTEATGRRARRDYSQPVAGLIPTGEPYRGGRRRAEDTIPKIKLPQLPLPPALTQQRPAAPEQAQPDPSPAQPTPGHPASEAPFAQTSAEPPLAGQAPVFGQPSVPPPMFGQTPVEPRPYGQAAAGSPMFGQAPDTRPFAQVPAEPPSFGQAPAAPPKSEVPPDHASGLVEFRSGFFLGQAAAAASKPAAQEPIQAEPVAPLPESAAPPVGDGDQVGAEGGSSFSALSEFSAMLARFDDPRQSAIELSEPPTTPLRPPAAEVAVPVVLPEPEMTPAPRVDRSMTAQPFAPETMFGSGAVAASGQPREQQATSPAPQTPATQTPAPQAPAVAEPTPVQPPGVQEPAVHEGLRPSPPPTGIAAKLSGPQDTEAESDVASIEGRSARGRRRTPKLGDLLTEALRAYQDVREADEGQNALSAASEPSELGATELGNWLGTGTEPLGSIDPPSWRPGSSTRSFGVARHGNGDDSGDSRRSSGPDWHPPTG